VFKELNSLKPSLLGWELQFNLLTVKTWEEVVADG
jgi:hypothetical protein